MTTHLIKGDLLEGRYRILDPIGQGGMGAVYLAEHMMLHRKCAIKVLHPSVAADATMLKRFRAEAQAAANVQHPNIVEVTDFGLTPDNLPFFVMEHLEGASLAKRLEDRGKLEAEEAVKLIGQILEGLAAAHKRGVIHRDLKPDNIFLADDPEGDIVKILDFGISKIVTGTPSRPPVPVSGKHKALTQKGMVFGTPGYMAPETLFGADAVDTRADLFSVAVILFEMLVGKQPFEKGDPHSTMVATASQDTPDPRELEPTVPAGLAEVILKGLQKDPDNRYQHPKAFMKALTEACSNPGPAPARKVKAPEPAPKIKAPKPAPPPQMEIEREPMAIMASSLELDDAYVPAHLSAPRPRYRDDGPSVGMPGKRPGFGAGVRRFSIAFSPIPLLFLALVGGGAYYYFVYQDPMKVVTDVDPVTREINRRVALHTDTGAEMATPESEDMVSIWIDAKPTDLQVFWNGEIKYERPIVVPQGQTFAEVQFKSPGFIAETMTIMPDKEKTITVRLKKERRRRKR